MLLLKTRLLGAWELAVLPLEVLRVLKEAAPTPGTGEGPGGADEAWGYGQSSTGWEDGAQGRQEGTGTEAWAVAGCGGWPGLPAARGVPALCCGCPVPTQEGGRACWHLGRHSSQEGRDPDPRRTLRSWEPPKATPWLADDRVVVRLETRGRLTLQMKNQRLSFGFITVRCSDTCRVGDSTFSLTAHSSLFLFSPY